MIEIYKKAFDYMRKNFVDSILFIISSAVLWTLSIAIPILGVIIYSYFYPNVVAWYYTKVTGDNINPDYKTAFLSLLIPNLLASIGIIYLFYGITSASIGPSASAGYINTFGLTNYQYVSYNPTLIIVELVIIIISIILSILLMYTFYGSILGKVNKLSIYFEKSFILLSYMLLYAIIASIILFIIYIIYALIISISYGMLIFFILLTIFVVPTVTLVALLKAKEL
ncbi:putative membrane protein [Candidatus Nanobsidianus stetteri]|uniref:Putative membrane protein n=1 Tax=Nanobsidianus stetteri TaxID=1294122 RepID=R1FUR0_NANST|nr:putative membrane protein [Candidatus Nanobsidianus stetteri]